MVNSLVPSVVGLIVAVAASPLLSDFSSSGSLHPRATSCLTSEPSCRNTTVQTNLCCFEAPGGLLMQTQFWNTKPSIGPSNSWTIHGLWPDHCDGTWDEFCDASREYPSITTVLNNNGKTDLLSYMNKYWISNDGDNESFWEHEWNKHGTCMSTLKSSCLPSGSRTGLDAAYYFQETVDLFKTLDTYSILAGAGIIPSSTATFTLSQLTSAVRAKFGYTPAFDCSSGVVNAVSYYFSLKGSVIDGSWVPMDAHKAGTCPSTGIKYPPKSGGSTPTSSTAGPIPTGTDVPSKSTITVALSSGTSAGCLLSYGTWSTQTCATMTVATSGSGFTITSSKGKCAIVSGALSCDSSISAGSVFTMTLSGGKFLLTYDGSTAFTADSVPSGTTQIALYNGSAHSQDITLVINTA